jgi:hydroxymethylglutaryl-CoA synthase
VVDFTFACIAGVDAMQNCLDFIRLNPKKKTIVATDFAKYDLNSTGNTRRRQQCCLPPIPNYCI